MSKRCMTLVPCNYEAHCKHRKVHQNQTTLFFQPPHVGEHCHHYELATSPIDHHDEIMAKMGALA